MCKPPFQGPALASYAYDGLGVDTAYTLAMLGSDYDQGLVHYFTEAFKALGGTVISEDFPEGSSNFVSYINNAKSAGAGVIFAPVSINYAQLIIEAAHAQGFEGSLLGSDTWDSNMITEAAKGKDVRVAVTTFYQEGVNPEFDNGIKEWINSNPTAKTNNAGNDVVAAVTTMGYDAYFTALEALKLAGSPDRADVLAAMPKLDFEGVSGRIHFDENGDAIRDEAVIKAANTETGNWDFDPGFVPFSDGSWIVGGVGFNAETGETFCLEDPKPLSGEKFDEISSAVAEFAEINNLILETNYYGKK